MQKLRLLFTTLRTASAQIYVSPTGNDRNAGTQDQPIRTLHHARDLVRAKNSRMTADITVHLAGGTYRMVEPLLVGTADSGNNGHQIIYSALHDVARHLFAIGQCTSRTAKRAFISRRRRGPAVTNRAPCWATCSW